MQTKRYQKDAVPERLEFCGVTAPLALWNAAGFEIINWVGDEVEFPRARDGATEADVIEARIHTGATDEAALVWLIQEHRRRHEESARNKAALMAAQAQKKAGDDAIHAARIERQAAELRCLAAGIDKRAIDSRLQ